MLGKNGLVSPLWAAFALLVLSSAAPVSAAHRRRKAKPKSDYKAFIVREGRSLSNDWKREMKPLKAPGIKGARYLTLKAGKGGPVYPGDIVLLQYWESTRIIYSNYKVKEFATLDSGDRLPHKDVFHGNETLSLKRYVDPCLKAGLLKMRGGGSALIRCPPQADYIPALHRAGKIPLGSYSWPKSFPPYWGDPKLYKILRLDILDSRTADYWPLPPQYPLGIKPGSQSQEEKPAERAASSQ